MIKFWKLKNKNLGTIWKILETRFSKSLELIWCKFKTRITIWIFTTFWKPQTISELLKENFKLQKSFPQGRKIEIKFYLAMNNNLTDSKIICKVARTYCVCSHNMTVRQPILWGNRILCKMWTTKINHVDLHKLRIYLMANWTAITTNWMLWGEIWYIVQARITWVTKRLLDDIQTVSFIEHTSIWTRRKAVITKIKLLMKWTIISETSKPVWMLASSKTFQTSFKMSLTISNMQRLALVLNYDNKIFKIRVQTLLIFKT